MKKIFLFIAVCACNLQAGDTKKFALDLAAAPEGDPPQEVFVVDGVMKIAAHDGHKVLAITGDKPEVEAGAVIGSSANGAASVTARIFASKSGRTQPKFSIGIHGQTGFRLVVFPAKKELQLVKNDEVIAAAPFEWTSETWVNLELAAVRLIDGRREIRGKAWTEGAAVPAKPQITHDVDKLNTHGQCSLWGTPLSGTPILFDQVRAEVEN